MDDSPLLLSSKSNKRVLNNYFSTNKFRISLFCMGTMLLSSCQTPVKEIPSDPESFLVVGSYTTNFKSDTGIHVFRLNTETGDCIPVSSYAGIKDPSYLAFNSSYDRMYTVSEGGNDGAANAFSFDDTNGTLHFLNKEPTNGGAPCYIAVSPDDRSVVTANYNGGNISVFPILENGSLGKCSQEFRFEGQGVDPVRQSQAHLHTVRFSPDSTFLFATDLGLDKIYRFRLTPDDSAYLAPEEPIAFQLKAGSGPRHLEWHPNGRFLYVINELSGTVNLFRYDHGDLTPVDEVVCDSLQAAGSADIHITPDGKYLYASNRLKGDGIAIFRIDPEGRPVRIGYQPTGIHPRNFMITPNGKFLLAACRDSNSVLFYRILDTGLLEETGQKLTISAPVCLKLAPFKKM